MTWLHVFGLALCAPSVYAGYGRSSSVTVLTSKNFDDEVTKSSGIAFVAFYAPWCGHCKALEPEWKAAARMLEGIVTIGALDATGKGNEPLAGKFGVKGFPTIKVFGANKNAPTAYNGERKAKAIVAEAMRQLSNLIRSRGGGGGGSGGGGGGGGGSGDDANVVDLTESAFDTQVLNSKDLWVVKFVAPWCGHCKKLEPEYLEAATTLVGEAKLGSVDATAEESLGSRFGVKGFPTIKIFPPKTARDEDAIDYEGPRDADGIVNEVQLLLEKYAGPIEVLQLTSNDALEAACPSKRICVVAVLPHILDGGKAERKKYLSMLVEVATKKRRGPFRFVWSEGGAQREIEDALGLNFGYPALVGVSRAKGVAAVHRGAFDAKKISHFLTGITSGRTKTARLGGEIPKAKAVAQWDGEDAVVVEEEEFSLADIMGDDDDETEL